MLCINNNFCLTDGREQLSSLRLSQVHCSTRVKTINKTLLLLPRYHRYSSENQSKFFI